MKKKFPALIATLLIVLSIQVPAFAQEKKGMDVGYSFSVEQSNTVVDAAIQPNSSAASITLSIQEKGSSTPQDTKTLNATIKQKVSAQFTGLKANTGYSLTAVVTPTDTAYRVLRQTWEFTTTYGNTGNPNVTSAGSAAGQGSNNSGLDGTQNGNTNTGLTGTNPSLSAGSQLTDVPLKVKLINPLGVDTIQGAIKKFMDAVVKIAIPFIVVFFIWSGLQFILAQGNPEKLKIAKKAFWWTVVGTLLILGAWAITDAIVGTINSIAS